jgi:6-phosphofructokinase
VNGGVCIVRLFGRDSGFLAAYAALASGYANIVFDEKFTIGLFIFMKKAYSGRTLHITRTF